MTETAADTLTIEHTIRIAASPETVWTFWTEPERLGEWWGTGVEVEAEPGGLFRVVPREMGAQRGRRAARTRHNTSRNHDDSR